jgi:uncharacterized membrane protein
MQNPFTAYSFKVTILTICLAVGGIGAFNIILKQPAISAFPFIIVLFYAASLVVFYLLERLTNSNPKRFIQFYTLFSGMKLIFYSLCLIIMLFAWRTDALKIALCFGICYACYTGMEILSVLKNMK